MHLNHSAEGISMEKMLGQSVFIAHPLWTWEGAGLGHWQHCPGHWIHILPGRPLSPGQCSSVLWTQASHFHGSTDRIVWKIMFEGDVFWAISVLACMGTFNSAFITSFLSWALLCKMLCEAQKWEKVAFVNLARSHPELVNSAKGWFFQPLPKDIHTKKTVFREYCIRICR